MSKLVPSSGEEQLERVINLSIVDLVEEAFNAGLRNNRDTLGELMAGARVHDIMHERLNEVLKHNGIGAEDEAGHPETKEEGAKVPGHAVLRHPQGSREDLPVLPDNDEVFDK